MALMKIKMEIDGLREINTMPPMQEIQLFQMA